MQFVITDKASGNVVRAGRVSDAAGETLEDGIPDTQVFHRIGDFDALPTPDKHKYDSDTKQFIACDVTNLPPRRDLKTKLLRAACDAEIEGGFLSGALGAAYRYPSGRTDQLNMLQGGDLMCEDPSGSWALRSHTDAQAATVRADFITVRDAARAKLATLLTIVQAATTPTAIDAVSWD